MILAGTYDVVGDGGRWSGTADEIVVQCPSWEMRVAVLRGSGAYEGLNAYVVTDQADPGEAVVKAVIFPDPRPRVP